VIAPATPIPETVTPAKPKSGFLKTFFIVIALILFGILIGVLAAKYIPMPSATITPTPTPTPTVLLTPTPTELVTPSASISGELIPVASPSAAAVKGTL